MLTQCELVHIIRQPDQRYPQQRRLPQLKAATPVGLQIFLQLLLLIPLFHSPPILPLEWSLHALVDNLYRPFDSFPIHPGPQNPISLDHSLPGPLQSLLVEIVPDRETDLSKVDAAFRRVDRMEKHSLLHRRQWIDVLDIPPVTDEPIQLLLAERRQRKVDRSVSACTRLPAILGYVPQLLNATSC